MYGTQFCSGRQTLVLDGYDSRDGVETAMIISDTAGVIWRGSPWEARAAWAAVTTALTAEGRPTASSGKETLR